MGGWLITKMTLAVTPMEKRLKASPKKDLIKWTRRVDKEKMQKLHIEYKENHISHSDPCVLNVIISPNTKD